MKEKSNDILTATAQAGREIVESMQVQPDTMKRITQMIVEDKAMFHQIGNLFWKTCIAEGVTPKEFAEKGLIPRPDSIESFLMILKMGFNASAAADVSATVQFDFDGDVRGTCHFDINDSQFEAKMGAAENASVTIISPFEPWMDIMAGKADGQQMFMEQKYTVKGIFNRLMALKR